MNDLLRFNRMVTPVIIEIMYWVMAGGCVLWGIILIVQGASNAFGGGATVLVGLVILLAGPVVARVYCEILLVVFKIHEAVEVIRNAVEAPPDQVE